MAHAQLNPAYDEAIFTAYIAQETVRRRIVNDVYTYTNYGWSVRAEYDVQYRTDSDQTPTTTVPDLTRRGVQMRNRLPDGSWTAWAYITTPTDEWIEIYDEQTAYSDGSNVSESIIFASPMDFSAFQEIRIRTRHFGDFVNNLPSNLGLQHDVIIRRPAAGWATSTVLSAATDASNAAGFYTVRERTRQTDFPPRFRVARSIDAELDDDVRRSGGHSEPSRRASWKFKLYSAAGSENSVTRVIHFGWPGNASYNRVQLGMWGR